MGKRDHLKDYVPTEDGGYEYVGTHWSWPGSETRSSFLRSARLLFAGAAACLIGAGFVPAPGTFGAFYVIIPFVACAIATALSGVALFRLSNEPDPMRDHVYASSAPTFEVKLLFGAMGGIVCGVAALIHGIALLAGGGGDLLLSVLFAACMVGCGVCLLLIRNAFSGIIFERV